MCFSKIDGIDYNGCTDERFEGWIGDWLFWINPKN